MTNMFSAMVCVVKTSLYSRERGHLLVQTRVRESFEPNPNDAVSSSLNPASPSSSRACVNRAESLEIAPCAFSSREMSQFTGHAAFVRISRDEREINRQRRFRALVSHAVASLTSTSRRVSTSDRITMLDVPTNATSPE